jgi:hypothetical protein
VAKTPAATRKGATAPGAGRPSDDSERRPAVADTADAAPAAEGNVLAAGAGTEHVPATDATKPEQSAAAAQSGAAAGPTHVDLAAAVSELPDMPAHVRATASLVVKAKADSRRRAGREFGRHETIIPLADLSDDAIRAIEGDPVLITHVRVTAPAG